MRGYPELSRRSSSKLCPRCPRTDENRRCSRKGSVNLHHPLRAVEQDPMPVEHVASQQNVRFIGTGNDLDHHGVAAPKAQLYKERAHGLQNACERRYVHRTELHEFQVIDHIGRHGGDVGSRVDLGRDLARRTSPIGPSEHEV